MQNLAIMENFKYISYQMAYLNATDADKESAIYKYAQGQYDAYKTIMKILGFEEKDIEEMDNDNKELANKYYAREEK